MNARPYKPPPESFGFLLLKLFWTVVALVLICGFFFLILVWPVSLLQLPGWVLIPLMVTYAGLCGGSYLFLKTTTLGKYLCDWPPYAF